MMKMTELQKILGERIEITLEKKLSPEERQTANEDSALIMELAKQMINNADLILRAEKLQAQNHALTDSVIIGMIK